MQLGQPDEACEVLRRMQLKGIRPDAVLLNTLLEAHARALQPLQAAAVLAQARRGELGPAPDCVSYTIVMSALARAGDSDAAERWFEVMRTEERIAPDVQSFNVMVHPALARSVGAGRGADRVAPHPVVVWREAGGEEGAALATQREALALVFLSCFRPTPFPSLMVSRQPLMAGAWVGVKRPARRCAQAAGRYAAGRCTSQPEGGEGGGG